MFYVLMCVSDASSNTLFCSKQRKKVGGCRVVKVLSDENVVNVAIISLLYIEYYVYSSCGYSIHLKPQALTHYIAYCSIETIFFCLLNSLKCLRPFNAVSVGYILQ